ncbi:MAG: PAS domain-containing sensor histidine kinase [SAR324 cluster bacterium]|nr:PAS domain-containing sensor histidine kinase [SAR324 cluster bacterium]
MGLKTKFSDIPGISQSINELIQKLPLAVAVINLDREIIAFNRAFFLLAGRDVRQGTPHCYQFLNFGFCQTDCLAHMSTHLARTISWDESEGTRSNGDELIIRPTVVPIMDQNGKAEGHILVFQNTTDEVHLYRSFRSNLEHLERRVSFLQTLNEAADEFRKIKQVDILLERISEFAVAHLSVDCCQLIGKTDQGQYVAAKTSSVSEIDKSRVNALKQSVLPAIELMDNESKPSHTEKFKEARASGQYQSTLLPIRSGGFDYGYLVVHYFSKVQDEDTELPSRTNEQLEYLELFAKSIGPYIENCHIIANLESIVDERTRELKNAQVQLMESTRLASVGETAGMVAHEILNPMTAILAKVRRLQDEESALGVAKFIADEWDKDLRESGVDELLENLKETPEGSEIPLVEEDLLNLREGITDCIKDLSFVEEQLHRIVSIVDNLRGLSRSQNKAERVDVRVAIEKTVELIRDGMRKRNIELITDFTHSSIVTCDANELIQVMHNLTRNAIQAIDNNGMLRITTSETTERVEIRIQDSGPGVPKKIAPRIFEMRFTTKNAQEGTGIGLNLSRRLMRQVMGDVELESPGGKGSGAVFLCWIPKRNKT